MNEEIIKMAREAYEVPLVEQLERVPKDARLVIDDADGMGTRFIPVGRMCHEAATALRQQIALEKKAENARELGLDYEPADEPVACKHKRYSVDVKEQTGTCHDCGAEGRMQFVVDDTRHQPQWVGLTNDEIWDVYKKVDSMQYKEFSRAIEAKLKSKNEHQ